MPLPGSVSARAEVEVNEKYGKSLAMAVAALDAWMRSYQYGWTDQCFLGYGQGIHWNSHTPLWRRLPPHAGLARPGPAQPLRLRRPDGGDEQCVPTSCAARRRTLWWAPTPSATAAAGRSSSSLASSTASTTGTISATAPRRSRSACRSPGRQDHPAQADRRPSRVEPEGEEDRDPVRDDLAARFNVAERTFAIDESTGGMRGGLPPGSIFLYVFETAEQIPDAVSVSGATPGAASTGCSGKGVWIGLGGLAMILGGVLMIWHRHAGRTAPASNPRPPLGRDPKAYAPK